MSSKVSPTLARPDYRTRCLLFADSNQAKRFQDFFRLQTDLTTLFLYQVYETISSIFIKYAVATSDHSIATFFNIGLSITPLMGWLMFYLLHKLKHSSLSKKASSLLNIIEVIWIIGVNSQYGIAMLVALGRPQCKSGLDFSGCVKTASGQMPEMTVAGLLLFPIIQHTIACGVKFEATVVSWLLANFFIYYSIVRFHLYGSLTNCLYGTVFSLFLLIETHRQNIAQFKVASDLRLALVENEVMAAEVQANELRHMIGNVAHDLKTPLSAFSSGIDVVCSSAAEAMHAVARVSDRATREKLAQQLASISDSVADMANVKSFMLMTINRCIDYTKSSRGLRLVPRMETVSLKECVELPLSCVRKMQSKLVINLVPWAADIAPNIITDKQWLQENLLCLLSNAVKYSSRGGVSVTVTRSTNALRVRTSQATIEEVASFSLRADSLDEEHQLAFQPNTSSNSTVTASTGSFLRIEVEDTGIGLSDEKMQALFQPFKQAQRHAGGTGLGLFSLARRIEALGGHYGVKRRPDGQEGSLFWFEIPYVPDAVQDTLLSPSLVSERKHPAKSSAASGSALEVEDVASSRRLPPALSILIVDDSLSIQKMSSMMLKKQGHTVAVAENGADALDKLAEAKQEGGKLFDVVLMDFQMPIMDGIEATRRIRSGEAVEDKCRMLEHLIEHNGKPSATTSKQRRQLIIGVSANSDAETLQDALLAGIDGFLQKPFSMQAFQAEYARLAELMSSK